jgi:hypothetical protein
MENDLKILETPVKNLAVNTLNSHGHLAFVMNVSNIPLLYKNKFGQFKKRRLISGYKGISDILGCHRTNGRFIAVEVKVIPNDATEHQKHFLAEISQRKGYAIKLRVRGEIDAQNQIERMVEWLDQQT